MRVIDIPVPYRFDGRSTGSNGLVDHDLLNLAVSFRRVPWASSHFAPKKNTPARNSSFTSHDTSMLSRCHVGLPPNSVRRSNGGPPRRLTASKIFCNQCDAVNPVSPRPCFSLAVCTAPPRHHDA